MISADDRHGSTQYREVEFISANWLDRAAWCPGLVVYSHPVKVPHFAPCRRHSDRRESDRIEHLLREALLPTPSEPFQSIECLN